MSMSAVVPTAGIVAKNTNMTGRRRDDYTLAEIVKTCLTGPDAGPIAIQVAGRLRQAIANRERYSVDTDALLSALLKAQPIAVLDALFSGEEDNQRAGLDLFEHLDGPGGNPANAIPCATLIAWCEGDRERRYPLAASIISFSYYPEAGAPHIWSDQARALLDGTPDPRIVLEKFIS